MPRLPTRGTLRNLMPWLENYSLYLKFARSRFRPVLLTIRPGTCSLSLLSTRTNGSTQTSSWKTKKHLKCTTRPCTRAWTTLSMTKAMWIYLFLASAQYASRSTRRRLKWPSQPSVSHVMSWWEGLVGSRVSSLLLPRSPSPECKVLARAILS